VPFTCEPLSLDGRNNGAVSVHLLELLLTQGFVLEFPTLAALSCRLPFSAEAERHSEFSPSGTSGLPFPSSCGSSAGLYGTRLNHLGICDVSGW
jgi:hypothetical protein